MLETINAAASGVASAGCAARLRVRFARRGPAAAMTQLEQIHALRSIAAASGLECAAGRGKAARPKMAFGPAVSVGYESDAEYADLYLASPVAEKEAYAKLSAACGGGFSVLGLKKIPVHFPSLESLVNAAEYRVAGVFGPGAQSALESFLARKEIPVVKKRQDGRTQTIDVRPLIIAMRFEGPDALELALRFGPGRTVKPERVLCECFGAGAAGAEASGWKILRKQLYWESASGALSVP
ncbi:MAG: TIGR03936 family radical SAM-associated protein [Elusimicrobiales bacterium]|nr:TIGR03936 family radical SAM-associated protein [Elusimicrobiales bacterium]